MTFKLKQIGKKPINKIIIEGDWNDADYISSTFDLSECYYPGLAILNEFYSKRKDIEENNLLDIRFDFEDCLKIFVETYVEDKKLKNQIFEKFDEVSEDLNEFIPYESNSDSGCHTIKIKILKDGIPHSFSYKYSIDELFELYLKEI